MSTIRTTIRIAHRAVICLALLFAGGVVAQDAEPELDPESGLVLSSSELVLEPEELEAGWLELTPLVSDAPAWLKRLGDRTSEDAELRLQPPVPPGAALLCTGAADAAVLCEQVYLQGEAWIESGESLAVEVRFEPGLAVRGRYLLDGWPISGARVAVVPAGLAVGRPFTMPLEVELARTRAPEIRREVSSDVDGRFALPRLAQGEYFLETVLPSGRIHRGEPFELPDPGALRRRTGAGEDQIVVWDLGEIDVADGLVVAFQVSDPAGEPIAGARVAGRQGRTPASLINYEAFTDGDGAARLSGFSVDEPLHLSCRKQGYRTLEQDYPLLPVLVTCILQPQAAVYGEVLGIEGLPTAGARVSLEPITIPPVAMEPVVGVEVPAAPPVPPTAKVDVAGRFSAGELAAGEYRLRAAAPGYEVAIETIVLEPGQRLELEAIVLLHGRALAGRVVDEETRAPIAGAEIRSVSPPGAMFEITGEDGDFVLATRAREPLVLALSAEDYAGREVTVLPERLAEREPLTLTLERGGKIRALVWDEATGLPCQSCRLVIKPSSTELTTSAAGEATSPTLTPGWYRVLRPRISHLGSTVIAEDDAESRHVRVRRGETSTVRFGERRRLVRIVFQPSPGAGWSLSARSPSRSERYQKGPGGGFQVRHRTGESVDLFLHRFEPETGGEVEVRQTTLPAEIATAEVVLPLAGARLRGRANSGGSPIPGARIRLRSLDHATLATARTRPDGSFAIPHLPAGVYDVVIGERSVQYVSLRAGQSLDLGTLQLIAGSF